MKCNQVLETHNTPLNILDFLLSVLKAVVSQGATQWKQRVSRADLGLIPDIKMALHKSRSDLDGAGTTAVILAIPQAQIIMHFVTKSPPTA